MRTTTKIHLSTVGLLIGLGAFIYISVLNPILLLFVVGAAAFLFLYGTLYIFISARFVAAKKRQREARMNRALELKDGLQLNFGGTNGLSSNAPGVQPPADRSVIGLVQDESLESEEQPAADSPGESDSGRSPDDPPGNDPNGGNGGQKPIVAPTPIKRSG